MTHTLGDIDLAGRVAEVTGGNSGIGFETARALAKSGAHVILAGRTRTSRDTAVTTLRAEQPRTSVAAAILDLADLAASDDELRKRLWSERL